MYNDLYGNYVGQPINDHLGLKWNTKAGLKMSRGHNVQRFEWILVGKPINDH